MSQLSVVCVLAAITFFSAHQKPSLQRTSMEFAGTTPCSNFVRPIHNIAPEPDCVYDDCRCFMVEWKLTLYINATTGAPSGYKLTAINRYSVKETNMYSQPGTSSSSEGSWTIIRGAGNNRNAIVYRLNPDQPLKSLNLLKLHDNLLHILDSYGRMLVGNEFFSYTLSRVSN